MNTIVKDPIKREQIKQQLIAKFAAIAVKTNNPDAADQWKPQPEFPVYVVYLYEMGGPYCVGFETELTAQLFMGELRNKPHVLDIAITDSYPWEIMHASSKKVDSRQPEPQKHKHGNI
jgi:hypothetical protein